MVFMCALLKNFVNNLMSSFAPQTNIFNTERILGARYKQSHTAQTLQKLIPQKKDIIVKVDTLECYSE